MALPPGAPGGVGGNTNLLGDLDTLRQVPGGRSEQDGGPGQARATSQPQKKPGKGAAASHSSSVQGPRPSLKDPQLYQRLMEECIAEEAAAAEGRQYSPPAVVVNYLVRNDVRPLKKRSVKFPRAQFFCRLCDYHCDSLTICISHIKDERHDRLARMQEVETTLYHLPKTSRQHVAHLDGLLSEVRAQAGMSAAEQRQRLRAAERVQAVMSGAGVADGDCAVRAYGGSLSGFGLADSGVNLDLAVEEERCPAHLALTAAAAALEAHPACAEVERRFTEKIPRIHFKLLPESDDGRAYSCELSLNNTLALQTSSLLSDYFRLDPRVPVLAAAVRLWARLCRVDRQAEGTLPPHAFDILLVFFLQQTSKPVLPCLHDHLEGRAPETYHSPEEAIQRWKTRNDLTPAELLIDFFEFFALGFRVADVIVSVRVAGGLSKADRNWKGKKLAIEDPFSTKRSLTRSIVSGSTLDYINDVFKIGYLYFGTIQTTEGPVITKILVPDDEAAPSTAQEQRAGGGKAKNTPKEQRNKSDEKKSVEALLSQLSVGEKATASTGAAGGSTSPPTAKPAIPTGKALTLEELEKSFAADEQDESEDEDEDRELQRVATLEEFTRRYGRELTPRQARRVTELVPRNKIRFVFDADILTAGHSPALACSVCGGDGHLQHACPEEQMPPARPLPTPLPQRVVQALDLICREVISRHAPLPNEIRQREQFVRDLTRLIRKSTDGAAGGGVPVLTVFGSSHNGFAFAHSDLDISLTFEGRETDEGIDAADVIERLAEKLKRIGGIRNVQAITSAKVPIVKFLCYQYQPRIEGDISLYNILAQENTKMLRCYSNIDPRVRILGYMVKKWAKACDIGDASRGSLSSYAYVLMMLHFLQQRNPPVIPVLQELHPPGERPTKIVDGWDAWFFGDLNRLPQVWPGLGQNRESVAELWLGFLQYYAVDFDDRALVVCTRRLEPLTKFEKMWISPCVAIEDPFELGHNLGAGISRKMNIYIKKCLLKTRERFGFFSPDRHASLASLWNYLWDPEHLCDGPLPNDRGCRACGKIGHLVRDCPKRRAHEEHQSRKQKERNLENHRRMASEVAAAKKQQQQQQQQHPRADANVPPVIDLNSALLSMLAGAAPAGPQTQQPAARPPPPPGLVAQMMSQPGMAAPRLPATAMSVSDLERTFGESSPAATTRPPQPPAPTVNPGGVRPTAGFQPMPPATSQQQTPPVRLAALPPFGFPPGQLLGQPQLRLLPPPATLPTAATAPPATFSVGNAIQPLLPPNTAAVPPQLCTPPMQAQQPQQPQQLWGGALGLFSFPAVTSAAQQMPQQHLQQQQARLQAPPFLAFNPDANAPRPLQLNDLPGLGFAPHQHLLAPGAQRLPAPAVTTAPSPATTTSASGFQNPWQP